ncbi:MAG: extracellular solute-binding protein, partial [Clostridia bacterium]|nr:extracellular solute-binding protein [Clostridia bacterium]
AVTACGAETTSPDPVTEAKTVASAIPAETEEENSYLRDTMPDDLDFGGKTVTIHVRGDVDSFLEVYAEEDGEILDDAIYRRNRTVEDRLNVRLDAFRAAGWQAYAGDMTKLRSTIMAGDDTYQIVAGWKAHIPQLTLEGCFMDLTGMPYLDLSMPWWSQTDSNGTRFGNGFYFVTGDISTITVLGGSYVMFMNDRLATDYDIPHIPDIVKSGAWTLDRMTEIIKNVSSDVNGDGKMDEHDQWGLWLDLYNSADAFYVSADIHQIAIRDGAPVYVPAVERTTKLMEKVYPLYYDRNGSYMNSDVDLQLNAFSEGRALFIIRELDESRFTMRQMTDNYTIFPMPKLDEEQKEYCTEGSTGATLWGIPTSCQAKEMSAAVIESLACESYNSFVQTYYQTCMKEKLSRNEDTMEMLEYVRAGIHLDAELTYGALLGETEYIIRNMLSSKNNNVASYYEKNNAKTEKAIQKTLDKLNSLQ